MGDTDAVIFEIIGTYQHNDQNYTVLKENDTKLMIFTKLKNILQFEYNDIEYQGMVMGKCYVNTRVPYSGRGYEYDAILQIHEDNKYKFQRQSYKMINKNNSIFKNSK